MSATKTYAALAVAVSEVGYHGTRRNALGDIFENLDVTKLTFKCCRSGGKGCNSCQTLSESVRRRATESFQAVDVADKALFADSYCSHNADHPVANGGTRLLAEKKLQTSRWVKSSSQFNNTPSSRCFSSYNDHNSNVAVAASSVVDLTTTNSHRNTKASSQANNVALTSMPQQQQLQQQQQQQHPANPKVANSLVRKVSQSQYSDQIDHLSSSMGNLRAKDCAKRSIVC